MFFTKRANKREVLILIFIQKTSFKNNFTFPMAISIILRPSQKISLIPKPNKTSKFVLQYLIHFSSKTTFYNQIVIEYFVEVMM